MAVDANNAGGPAQALARGYVTITADGNNLTAGSGSDKALPNPQASSEQDKAQLLNVTQRIFRQVDEFSGSIKGANKAANELTIVVPLTGNDYVLMIEQIVKAIAIEVKIEEFWEPTGSSGPQAFITSTYKNCTLKEIHRPEDNTTYGGPVVCYTFVSQSASVDGEQSSKSASADFFGTSSS